MIEKVKDLVISHAYAATSNNIGSSFFNLPGFSSNNVSSATTTAGNLINEVLNWVIAVVGLIAFIYLIINGVNYITAGGDAAKATTARQGVINAIIGIVIVVLAWIIVQFAFQLGTTLGGTAG